jgi:integrase
MPEDQHHEDHDPGVRRAFITAALDAGVPLRDIQEAASHAGPRTTMRQSGHGRPWTGTATYIVAGAAR